MVSISYSDGFTPGKGFAYDVNTLWSQTGTNLKGRLAVTASGSGSTANGSLFSYDPMGRVISLWQCAPSTCGTSNQASRPLSFTYDWAGNHTGESDAVSGSIAYTRSIAGEVTSITNQTYQNLPQNPPNLVSSVVNGPDGPVSYTLGNGLNVLDGYDTLGRLTGRWVCRGPATMYCSGGTQIYGTGGPWKGTRMLYQSDTVLNQQVTFGYDEFNRLNARTVTQGTVQNYTYGYDLYGNRVSQTPLQGGYSFNPTINPVNNQITTSGYVYDPAGNMTNDTVHSYAYDAEGNLVLVDGGNTAQYVYDVFNHRIRVQTTSATTEYLYDYAGRRVSSWVASSNTGNEGRIYWDGQMVAYRSLEAFTYFNHEDTLGTERIRTNYAGYTASTYQSLPWGDGYSSTVNNYGGDQDNLHFAGLERDAESGTEHAQFRNYASAQGRWLAPDSYLGSYDQTNPQSMNRYAYALNNPLSFLDPSGLTIMCSMLSGSLVCVDNGGNNNTDCDSNYTACASPGTDCVASGTEGCITASNPGNSTPLDPLPSYPFGSSGGSSGNAPNNGPTKGQCLGQALKNDGNGVSLALDVAGIGAGFLPGGGLVTGSARAANIAFSAQVGLTAASTGVSTAYKSGPGIVFGILGGQAALTAKTAEAFGEDAAEAFGESIPIVGVAVSAGALLYDGYQTYKAYSGCLAGAHE